MTEYRRVPLRRLTSFQYGDALAADVRVEGSVPVMSSGGVTGTHDKPNTLGPCIVVGRKGSHGSVHWSDEPAFVIDTAYGIDSRSVGCDLRWLYYVLLSADLASVSNDVGVPGLSREAAYETLVPSPPPLDVQRRVADFLDDQVTRIDNIISARQEQFHRLRELALSTAAAFTTVGGETNEQATQTGIAWMPERAADWPLVRLGYLCMTGSGTTPPADHQDYYDGDIPWVNSGDITPDGIQRIARTVTERALFDLSALKVYEPGSLVVAMYGQGETKGRVGLLPERACVNQACCVLCPDEALSPEWLAHWLRSHKEGITQLAQGSGQPNLNQELIRSLRIPLPPREAQERLLPQLSTEIQDNARTQAILDGSISMLSELKRSLISAAVSGGFDVSTADGSGVLV